MTDTQRATAEQQLAQHHTGHREPVADCQWCPVSDDAGRRREWTAALRWAADYAAAPFGGAQDGDLDSTDLRRMAARVEAGDLTPWADQPERVRPFDDGDPAPAPQDEVDAPAEHPRTAPAAAGPHPGTPDGAAGPELDLGAIADDLYEASEHIDHPDADYNPWALRALRTAEKLSSEVRRLRSAAAIRDDWARYGPREWDLDVIQGLLDNLDGLDDEHRQPDDRCRSATGDHLRALVAEVHRLRAQAPDPQHELAPEADVPSEPAVGLGPGILGRALLAGEDARYVFLATPDGLWGNPHWGEMTRAEVEDEVAGEVTEVLLVSPAAGPVLDAARELVAKRRNPTATDGDHARAEAWLWEAVDAADRDQPAEPGRCDCGRVDHAIGETCPAAEPAPEPDSDIDKLADMVASSPATWKHITDRFPGLAHQIERVIDPELRAEPAPEPAPRRYARDDEHPCGAPHPEGGATCRLLPHDDGTTHTRPASGGWDAWTEPAPEPAVVRCRCGERILHATPDGYGKEGCDDPDPDGEFDRLHQDLATAESRADRAEARCMELSAELQWARNPEPAPEPAASLGATGITPAAEPAPELGSGPGWDRIGVEGLIRWLTTEHTWPPHMEPEAVGRQLDALLADYDIRSQRNRDHVETHLRLAAERDKIGDERDAARAERDLWRRRAWQRRDYGTRWLRERNAARAELDRAGEARRARDALLRARGAAINPDREETARRDAAADALEWVAPHVRQSELLRGWAAEVRAGTGPVPGSPQPAPASGEEQ